MEDIRIGGNWIEWIKQVAPASDSGHLVVIVGGGGGQTDGGHPVTEAHVAGKLDDAKVIVITEGTVAGMDYPPT